MRQAIALCLDRQKVVDTVLYGQSSVPTSFTPPDHPLYLGGLPNYPFDPTAGSALLEQIGWKFVAGTGTTTAERHAVAVSGVVGGTPLVLDYVTTPSVQRRQVTDIISQSLAECGIGVKIEYESQQELYAPGGAGPLFGRNFDLAEYALSRSASAPPCGWFSSKGIPDALNHWVGVNISGYNNPNYDTACSLAESSLPGELAYADAYHRTQSIFASELPSIPLYFRLSVAAARGDFCHFNLDQTANPLWNLVAYDEGASCKK